MYWKFGTDCQKFSIISRPGKGIRIEKIMFLIFREVVTSKFHLSWGYFYNPEATWSSQNWNLYLKHWHFPSIFKCQRLKNALDINSVNLVPWGCELLCIIIVLKSPATANHIISNHSRSYLRHYQNRYLESFSLWGELSLWLPDNLLQDFFQQIIDFGAQNFRISYIFSCFLTHRQQKTFSVERKCKCHNYWLILLFVCYLKK